MSKKKFIFITFLILLLFGLVLGGGLLCFRLKRNYFASLKSTKSKINFLFLGINGTGGADRDLTDTIIFASLNPTNHKVIFVSIPRDIWVEDIKTKINAAFHYGGPDLVKKTLSNLLGQEMHYYAILNFDSFEKIIDYLDGVEVEVQRTFADYKFPIPGKEDDLCNGDKEYKCRYDPVYFEAGKQKMDGKTALKFVRSRNAEGEEGTDFARSMRQQKVLLAIKERFINSKIFLNPTKMLGLLRLIQEEIITDVTPKIYGSLAILGLKLTNQQVKVEMITLNDNLLINPKVHYSQQWVLVPRKGNWQEVRDFLDRKLE